MPPNSDMERAMKDALPRAANLWVNRAKGKAKTTRIRNSFNLSGVANEGDGRYSITISNTAPEAAAYEYGSGLTSTKKPPARYLIKSKSGKILSFLMPEGLNIDYSKVQPFPGNPDIPDDPETGRVFLPQVMHPGVKPEPYMQPAFEEVKPQMSQVIGRSFAVEVVHKSIREMWRSG